MSDNWLRTRLARLVLAATLSASLVLGGAFVALDQLHSVPADALHHPGPAATDQQSRAQAVRAAQNVVTVAGLRTTTAGYLLMSCKDRENPPYRGAVYLTFAIPADAAADTYLPEVVAKLLAGGWSPGLPPGNHALASTLTKDELTASIYRHDDNPDLGILRVYGECRNVTDHHADPTGWVDVTGEFGPAG